MKLVASHVTPYRLRFAEPVITSRIALTHREGWLVRLAGADGAVGHGDAASWPGFGSSPAAVESDLQRLGQPRTLEALESVTADGIAAWLAAQRFVPEVAYAAELALFDLLGQRRGRAVSALLCETPRSAIDVHRLVFDPAAARRAVDDGFTTLKVKVGASSLADDERRLAAIRDAVGALVRLRLDANGAWTTGEACAAVARLAKLDVEWFEQPVAAADVEGLHAVRERTGVAVAVDESITDAASLERIVKARAADVVVLKPMFAGGLNAALSMARRAADAGMRVSVTHAMESLVGRIGAVHLAAAIDGGLTACGLTNPLAEDFGPALAHERGRMVVPTRAGLGVSLDATPPRRDHATSRLEGVL